MGGNQRQDQSRVSHGSGQFERAQFRSIGDGVVIEPGVLVFHPENIEIGEDVYIGHYTILKGYYRGRMAIGSGAWIGQQCFFHSGGNLIIGKNVGIGPGVKIITSYHAEEGISKPILHSRIEFSPVVIEDDADIGIGAIILPGVLIGRGAQVGAGAVVTRNVSAYAVVAGAPAQLLRMR
ncbi:MAG: transferase [Syntrophobacterales bacterium CG_4_8_14_3_um_filter_49_14]|nr:MAG: transferase [Syntrophobacterales bacterium CG23_combo_of_CG06-09_8_20_14_all_48_27]PJA47772.1 MAG: transferase [Syntrophobacterales bacterium CG_4_9_14_3_um_filter_49_8]PJC76521.1 MAG: transferase [Syntrophobacterales bacterium CG_4_8_14_3_um_filter_49_14]